MLPKIVLSRTARLKLAQVSDDEDRKKSNQDWPCVLIFLTYQKGPKASKLPKAMQRKQLAYQAEDVVGADVCPHVNLCQSEVVFFLVSPKEHH